MKSDNKKQYQHIILGAILVLGFIVRYGGITFGFPSIVHMDEPKIVNRAINMAQTGFYNPYFFNYPSLYIYIQSELFRMCFLLGKMFGVVDRYSDIDILFFMYIGRLLTIVLSLFSIKIWYSVCKKLFCSNIALVTALFITFSILHVENSYMVTVDMPMTFWAVLSFFFSVKIYQKNHSYLYYFLNSITIGLATGTKYNGIFIVIPFVFAHFLSQPLSRKSILNRKMIYSLLLIPIFFLLSTPYALIDYPRFFKHLIYESNHYSTGHFGADIGNSYIFYLKALVEKMGLIPFLLNFWGIIVLSKKDYRKCLFIISFPLVYYLFVGRYKVHFDRNIVVLIPFVALLASYGFWVVIGYLSKVMQEKKLSVWNNVVIAFLMILVLVNSIQQIQQILIKNKSICLTPTQYIAKEWFENNISPGKTVAREYYTPEIDSVVYNVDVIPLMKIPDSELTQYDYIISSSGYYKRFFDNKKIYTKEAQFYQDLLRKNNSVKTISSNLHSSGPVIHIFQMKLDNK